MDLNISQFRRAEELLIALVGAELAETVCTAIALCADRPIPDPHAFDDITIPLCDFAGRLGLDLEGASDRLKRADAAMDDAFGVHILKAADDIFDPRSLVSLHADFVDVARGISAGIQPMLPSRPQADTESQEWLALVARAAGCGRSPLLYRCVRDYADRADETLDVACALSRGEDGVLVLDPNAAGRRVPPAALVLSAILNQSGRTLVIASDIVVPPNEEAPADDYFVDAEERPRHKAEPLSAFSAAGERLLAVAAAAPIVVIIPVAMNARFSPKALRRVIGVVGPLRFDRAASVAAVQSMVSWPLSDALAGQIVSLFPDANASRQVLDAAERFVQAERNRAGRKKRGHGEAEECNALAGRLVRGIEPHIATSRSTRPMNIDEPFYPELITCADRRLLLDPANGDRLRRAGVRIGLFGVAGTGKTKFAAAVAANLKCQALHVQSSDILAYKLGQLERNLHGVFQKARELNAVLIFDEFDSIGSSRAEAGGASYIISLTNSILVEMDAHPLPIITASNFFNRIDAAIRRRYDISTELFPIPESVEPKAFELILGLRNHDKIIGRTCISDYAHARKIALLTGDNSLDAAVAAVCKAREVRLGEARQIGRVGFI